MTYASIMVAMDLAPDARDRARVAGHLADAFHARLIGVAADQPALVAAPAGPTPGSMQALATSDEAILDRLRMVHAAFEASVAGRSRVSWRSGIGAPLSFLVTEAAVADLVVLGARMGIEPTSFSVDPANALIQLGRPALIVPPGIDHLDATRIVIGWKNTREARRAVRDALPFLKRASIVGVVAVDDGQTRVDTKAVIDFLQSHDIAADTVAMDPFGATVGEALIEAATERAAGLIVAGAHGHGRLREWAFGGVTRTLLTSAPICCLLSH